MDGKRVELSVPVQKAHQGPGQNHQARRHGQDEKQRPPEGLAQGVGKGVLIVSGAETGEFWENHVGNGQHKNAG